MSATVCSRVPASLQCQPRHPACFMPDSLPAPLSYTAPRPSLHPLIAQVYLAEWAATQVAVKVLIGGQLASSGEVQRALALSAPIQQKLEAEASLLASLRCGGGVCWRASGWEQVGLTARNRPCWHCCCLTASPNARPPPPFPTTHTGTPTWSTSWPSATSRPALSPNTAPGAAWPRYGWRGGCLGLGGQRMSRCSTAANQ